MSETSRPQQASGRRTGSIKAGGKIEAEHIVTGVQVHGTDAETARAMLALAQDIDSGSVEAVQDIIAKNLVTGFQYLGQGGTEPNHEQFHQELTALRAQMAQAIAAGEIEDEEDAEDVQTALDRTIKHTRAETPVAEKIATNLERADSIITRAATVAESAGKFQAAVIKLAPVVKALGRLVSVFF